MIEAYHKNRKMNVYVFPIMVESLIFIGIVGFSHFYDHQEFPNLVACLLLFAMGLQNSYVTKISNAVVRTTHLTGLFTDLGIELSHWAVSNKHNRGPQVKSNIKLRLYIIGFFFLGGLFG